MPQVPEELEPYFLQLRNEVLAIDAEVDEARKFELWVKENILKKYYSVEDELIWHPGLQGNDLKIDLAAKRSDGMYIIVQAKWCESEDGIDGYNKMSNDDVMELSQALEEIESNAEINNEQRNLFVQQLKEDYDGDTWREHVQLIFVCNTELVNTDAVKNNIAHHHIISFRLSELENVSNLDLVAESKVLDVRNWKFENGVGFGTVYAKDLGEWVSIRDGTGSVIKNQRYFAENLRFNLPNKAKAKEIRQKIDDSFENQSELFLAKNNGILVLGTKVNGMENGFRIDQSLTEIRNNRARDSLAGELDALENNTNTDDFSEDERDKHDLLITGKIAELETIRAEIQDAVNNVTGLIISQPSIANGGQTTSAAFDNYAAGTDTLDNNAQIAIKFVAAPEEGGSAFRHEIAVASNRQNAIDERDEVANDSRQVAIRQFLKNKAQAILFDHKKGLVKSVEENAAEKANYSCSTWDNGTGTIRTITNENWGNILLSTIHEIPHDVQKGKKATQMFDMTHDNYSNCFSTPSDYMLRTVLLGNFLIKATKVIKSSGNEKKNDYLAPFEADADDQGLTGNEKVAFMKEHKDQWQISMGFTNYWTWAVIHLFHKIITRISNIHHNSEGTIFAGKNEEESKNILLNLLLTGNHESDILNNPECLDRLWYNTPNRFTTSYDDKQMLNNIAQNNEMMFSEDGTCSDHLPQLFATLRRIEYVFRIKYPIYASNKSSAFQNLTLINACWEDISPMCVMKESVLERFGISLNVENAAGNADQEMTLEVLLIQWANIVAAGTPVAMKTWATANVENPLLQTDDQMAISLKAELEGYI